jgi:acetyl-CoA carboxylase biotin carboxyl carrier protein
VIVELTHSDIQSILKMIDAAEHLDEIEIVHGGFRLHVVRNGGGGLRRESPSVSVTQPTAEIAAEPKLTSTTSVEARSPPPAAPKAPVQIPEGVTAIRAPMLGVFYRASAPGERAFVEVGQRVRADDTVCLIEVMKLFNSIRAGVDGEVVKILADNASLVEFDEALILIKPS